MKRTIDPQGPPLDHDGDRQGIPLTITEQISGVAIGPHCPRPRFSPAKLDDRSLLPLRCIFHSDIQSRSDATREGNNHRIKPQNVIRVVTEMKFEPILGFDSIRNIGVFPYPGSSFQSERGGSSAFHAGGPFGRGKGLRAISPRQRKKRARPIAFQTSVREILIFSCITLSTPAARSFDTVAPASKWGSRVQKRTRESRTRVR